MTTEKRSAWPGLESAAALNWDDSALVVWQNAPYLEQGITFGEVRALLNSHAALLAACEALLLKACPDNPKCQVGQCAWMGDVEKEAAAAIAAATGQQAG